MIDIANLKLGDKFYKADLNGVNKCEMADENIQEFGSFAVFINDNKDNLRFLSKEDYEYLFYTKEEAEAMYKTLPDKIAGGLMEDNNWIKELFFIYSRSVDPIYVDGMRKAIKEKLGLEL